MKSARVPVSIGIAVGNHPKARRAHASIITDIRRFRHDEIRQRHGNGVVRLAADPHQQ